MVELVLRVIGSLLVVVGLLWVIARAGSRRFAANRGLVRVVARQPLARTASLAVVEVGERVLVVGVSENGVSLLTEMDPSEIPAAEPEPADAAEPVDAPDLADRRIGALTRSMPGARRAAASPSVAGSVLSGQTWRQAWEAATSRQGGRSD